MLVILTSTPSCPSWAVPVVDQNQGHQTFEFNAKSYSLSHRVFSDHQVVFYSGEMMPLSSREGLKILRQNIVIGLPISLHIESSGGGYVKSYEQLGDLLHSACTDHQGQRICEVTTYVQFYCGSACVNLYLLGDKRIASYYAMFGFHRKWMIIPELTIESYGSVIQQYTKQGVDEAWIQKNLHIFSEQREMTLLRSGQLLDSKIVHQQVISFDNQRSYSEDPR